MKLREIAHSRGGDKGDISNLSLIPYNEADYEKLKEKVTAEMEFCAGQSPGRRRAEKPGTGQAWQDLQCGFVRDGYRLVKTEGMKWQLN